MSNKRDFIETERTPGWEYYRKQVEDSIVKLKVELATIEIEDKTAEQIGIEHVRIAERIAGIERAMSITEDIKNEEADDL
jgi:citrate lyase gamma subunit